jgi:hypothetical protein
MTENTNITTTNANDLRNLDELAGEIEDLSIHLKNSVNKFKV